MMLADNDGGSLFNPGTEAGYRWKTLDVFASLRQCGTVPAR